jgi:hypothetical protein
MCAQAGGAQDGAPVPQAPLGTATVHGVVKNAVTNEPLPRVLVALSGNIGQAVLTDGDGRFEIPGVAVGTDVFELTKPGYADSANGPVLEDVWEENQGVTHNVVVTAETPELVFSMRPLNVIRGQMQLSTGDPAEKIVVMLLARTIVDGRATWRPRITRQTDSEGRYRFPGLPDGVYVIETLPSMDSDAGAAVSGLTDARVTPKGYANMFYPDVREFSSAAQIKVKGGEQATANMTLAEEPFHLVRAAVLLPAQYRAGSSNPMSGPINGMVLDTQGRDTAYPKQFDSDTHSLQALLPDGTYTLRAAADLDMGTRLSLRGDTAVSVAGKPVTNLRIVLAQEAFNPLQVSVTHGSPQNAGAIGKGAIFVSVSQAMPASDGMNSAYAEGPAPGTLETYPLPPGAYWLHTVMAQAGLCESSFTAGGASLAREPLVVNQGGTTAPLTLILRDDCGNLKLRLPPAMAALTAGEERAYTVYVVPDFDSTTEVHVVTVRPSSGETAEVSMLTPGDYHLYTFAAPVGLEYRNPQAMAGLKGQAVTVPQGATKEVVLEGPAK